MPPGLDHFHGFKKQPLWRRKRHSWESCSIGNICLESPVHNASDGILYQCFIADHVYYYRFLLFSFLSVLHTHYLLLNQKQRRIPNFLLSMHTDHLLSTMHQTAPLKKRSSKSRSAPLRLRMSAKILRSPARSWSTSWSARMWPPPTAPMDSLPSMPMRQWRRSSVKLKQKQMLRLILNFMALVLLQFSHFWSTAALTLYRNTASRSLK